MCVVTTKCGVGDGSRTPEGFEYFYTCSYVCVTVTKLYRCVAGIKMKAELGLVCGLTTVNEAKICH